MIYEQPSYAQLPESRKWTSSASSWSQKASVKTGKVQIPGFTSSKIFFAFSPGDFLGENRCGKPPRSEGRSEWISFEQSHAR